MNPISTQITIAPRGKSWHGEYLRNDTKGSPVRPSAPAWMGGPPPEGIEVAWLRLESPDEDGEPIASVVLGCVSMDASLGWCVAANWEGDCHDDCVEGVITHWLPYTVPASRLK